MTCHSYAEPWRPSGAQAACAGTGSLGDYWPLALDCCLRVGRDICKADVQEIFIIGSAAERRIRKVLVRRHAKVGVIRAAELGGDARPERSDVRKIIAETPREVLDEHKVEL